MAIDGTSGNDTLVGTSASEEINGFAGDDLLTGNAGNDTLDGGAGTDTAVFSGNRADYAISYNSGDSSWTVEHLGGGTDGTDTVRNIEFLQFADQTVSTSLASQPVVDQGIGNQNAMEDNAFNFAVPVDAFSDADTMDNLSYSATLSGGGTLPSWLTFDGTNFSGTPLNDDVGTITIEVVATDLQGNTISTTFDLTTGNVNDAPTVDQGIADQNATEDAAFSFAVPADAFEDVDAGDSLIYSATLTGGDALPAWLSFDGTTFTGMPTNNEVGSLSVDVTATDQSGATVTETFTLNVINTNDAPTVDQGLANQDATEDVAFSYTIPSDAFADVDLGDNLTYTASLSDGTALPAWLNFDGSSFTGIPLNDDGGSISVEVTVTDTSGAFAKETFTLAVMNVNDTPVVEDANVVMQVNSHISGSVHGEDEETSRADLTFSLLTGSSNGTLIFNADGTYTYTPSDNYVGTDTFTYRVTDPEGLTDEGQIDINIYPNAIEDQSEDIVNTTTISAQYLASTAGLNWGGYVVTWTSYAGIPDRYEIMGQLYDNHGAKVGSEFTVNTTGYNTDQNYSSTTGLNDGGFIVTWQSLSQDGSGYGVYGQKFDSNGNMVGSEFQVNTYTTSDQKFSEVTGLSDGGFIVTWESFGQDGSYQGIYMQRYDAGGIAVGSETLVNTTTYNRQMAPTITEIVNGNIVVVWSGRDSSSGGIKGQIYDSTGTTVGSEFQLNTHTISSQVYPSVTALKGGGFVATWASNDQDGSGYGVFARRYDAGGVAIGNEFQVNTYWTSAQDYISTAGLEDGGFVVTWASLGQDGDGYGVYGQRYDASGIAIGGEFHISDGETVGNQTEPSVAALAGGGFVVSWASQNQDGDGYGVYRRVFSGTVDPATSFSGMAGNDVLIGSIQDENLIGYAGNDQIEADSGNDTLSGGAGADTLSGGGGADTYSYARGDGQDVIDDASSDGSSDTLELSTAINHDQLWFEQSGDDLLISVIGTSDQITVDNWYQSADNKIETIESSDGKTLDISGVEALVTAMATFSPPGAGQTDLSDPAYNDLQDDLTANWQT